MPAPVISPVWPTEVVVTATPETPAPAVPAPPLRPRPMDFYRLRGETPVICRPTRLRKPKRPGVEWI